MDIVKYPMREKTERPLFNYLVKDLIHMDYYLFEEFDDALKQAQSMSLDGNRHVLIYETYFNAKTREWHGCNTFSVVDGRVEYDRHAGIELHLEFYVNAGEWLNPNQDWINKINKE